MTLVFLFTLGIGQMWGAWSTADMPTSTLTCSASASTGITKSYNFHSDATNSDTIVFSVYDAYNTSVTWGTKTASDITNTSKSWNPIIYRAASGNASAGNSVYAGGGNMLTKFRPARKVRFLVTNCTGAMISGLVGSSKSLTLNAYLYSGGEMASTPAVSGSTITSTSIASTSISGLSAANTYVIEIAGGAENNDQHLAEVAFIYPHATSGGDTTAPTLSSSAPANNATDIDVSGNIALTFSENVTINDASKFTLSGGAGSLTTAGFSASGAVVTLPYANLANGTEYTLSIAKDAVKDGSNNKNTASYSVKFTTVAASGGGEDPEPPAVVCPESGVLFSADAKTTSDKKISTGTTEITSSDADITGGAVYAISGQSDQKVLLTKNGQFSMTNNNTIFEFELDCALAAGDKITIDGQGGVKNSVNKGLWITSTEERPSSAPACSGDNGTDGWYEPILSYVVTSTDEYVGKTTLFIHRQAGATQYFDNVVITRPYNISYVSAKGTAQTTPTKGFEVALTQITGIDGWNHTGWTANKAVKVGTTDYAVGDEIPASATAKLSDDTQFTAVWVEDLSPAETPVIATDPASANYSWKDAIAALTVSVNSVSDGGTLHYQWYKEAGENDTKVGTDANSYTPEEAGTYYVVVTNKKTGNEDASATSNNAVITIGTRPSYTVTYYDGASSIGSESVLDEASPVEYAAKQAKACHEFVAWYNNSDLAEEHKIADISALVVTGNTPVYGKWTGNYAFGDYSFVNVAEVGTAPNKLTMTDGTAVNVAAGSRVDNFYFSAMAIKYESGASDALTDYKGWKINTKDATIKFLVENDAQVKVGIGQKTDLNVSYTNTESTAQNVSLTQQSEGSYNVKGGTIVTLTMTSDNTTTLKYIKIGDIPAKSDDATLSDLTLKYGEAAAATISGFSASKYIYNVDVPFGTAKADLPIVGATATDPTNALVSINQAKDREDWKTVIRVQAEDRIDDHDKYYEVRFNVLPKLGVELIKVVVPAGTHNDTEATGYFGGTGDTKNEGNSLKIGGGCYAGVVLTTEKTFKAGDVINIHTSAVSTSGGSVIKIYADNSASTLLYNTETIGGDAAGNNFFVLPEAVNNQSSLYVVRTSDNKWNGSIDYIAVYRQMAPFIEEFKIGEAVGTINKSAKTIAVEVPYSADLEHLTPTVKYWANGGGTITPAIGETDFSGVVNYTVSSAYAEDETGDYAPVTYAVTVSKAAHYEAKIGDVGYATLVEAVAAATDGQTVKLLEDVNAGAGVMIAKADAKQITIDFGGYTYTANSPAVGSVGTQNQAFHFEKGCDITLKNGTITSEGNAIIMLVQNYGDLTLEDITLDGTGLEGSHRYVMSNNCGDVVIGDGTTITAKTGDVAFDVCATNYYPEGVTVTVKEGATISGIVEYDVWGTKPADNHAELAIEGGNFDVTWNVEDALAEDAKDNLNVSGGTFTAAVPADYCAEGYAPTSWTIGTETKYGVHLAGVIRGAASTNSDGVYYYTLDNDVTIFSSESDGRLKTSNHIATSSDVVACGGDNGGYNVNKSAFVLQFPVNVKEFTIYGANSTERTISKVYVNATASTEIKIKNVGRELTGTYTNTKDEKCQTLTAVFAGENIISANDYVLINLSGSVNMYRILYTEAECTDPVITAVNNTIGTVGESATVSVEATALGATYQWYTCDENGDNAEIIGTATAASYTFTKGAGVEYFKVVVGNNCNTATVSAVAKAEVWAPTTTLVDVTENTTWDWTLVTSRADGSAIDDSDGNGPKLNTTNGMIIGNYILGNNFDKVEGNNGAYAIRKAANKYYQGASLHMHTTVSGYLSIWAANEGHSMTLNLVNDGRDMQIAQLTDSQVEYKVYVKAGDVVIYNIPASSTYPMRVSKMIFTVDETPDYTRNVSNNIGTLCVDHNVVAGGALGATFYQIASRNELYDYKIDFEEVLPGEELKAGQPYIFKSNTGKIELFYGATVADAPVAVRGMIGSFVDTQVDIDEDNKSNILYIASNKLWNCEDLVGIGLEVVANRAYIVMSEVPTYADYQAAQTSNPAPRRRVTLGKDEAQVVTGFGELETSETPVKVLINGQIFIIRGEKMFDVTGKLVK